MASSIPQEKVFRLFTSEEGKFYAAQRLAYPPALYKLIFEHHATTGGSFGTLLDVGCGPGNSIRDLATAFETALGVDASSGMIASARELGGTTGSGETVRYEISSAESYSAVEGLEAGSVDLLTVASAAHWFDMSKFWVEGAKVLKPGGTVAIWVRSTRTCHPSTPNAAKIKEILRRFAEETLAPYYQPGNALTLCLYDDLVLPWQSVPCVEGFPESLFVKHVYDRDGILSDGKDFFGGGQKINLAHMSKSLATSSPVLRWRAAHPSLAGTEKDLVAMLGREIKEALGDQTSLVVGGGTAILLFKKVAEKEM